MLLALCIVLAVGAWRTRAVPAGPVPAFVVLDARGHIRFAEVGYTSETGMRLRLWWAQTFP